MATTVERPGAEELEAPPSPAGPVTGDAAALPFPPGLRLPAIAQTLRFGLRPLPFVFNARRDLGEVFAVRLLSQPDTFAMTSHPDHVRSLFTAKPADAPSLTGESPLRPILGPNSVLTAVGERHMRQRKMLLPPFHGDAVKKYSEAITAAAEREVERWRVGEPFAIAPRMQAVTLDVIMAGVFGIEGRPDPDSAEGKFRTAIRRMTLASTHPAWQLLELRNLGRQEARGALKRMIEWLDGHVYRLIEQRRAAGGEGEDILSLLLSARDEDGEPLTDHELRDQLLSLIFAGHETTANSLAWTVERLVRWPAAYDRLREEVRGGGDDSYVDATIYEGMRVRPVIPFVVRRVQKPWQLGEYAVPPQTPVGVSIVLLHHREDVYPEPHAFRPERFVGRQPGTYTWVPFGGGIRRCLGAALAMAEQRVVLRTIAERVDLAAPDPRSEGGRQRNVTMIPRHGGRVVVKARR